MSEPWRTGRERRSQADVSLALGDHLPKLPDVIHSPEQRSANRGFGRAFRRLSIAITHLRRPLPLMPARDQLERIVVIHPGPLRELVFLEPTLRALRMRFRQADRVLYSTDEAAALYAGSGWGEVRPLSSLEQETKRSAEDNVVIDFTMQAEYGLAKFLKQKRFSHRVGINLGGRGAFFNIPAKPPLFTEHLVDYYLQLAEMIGTQPVGTIPSLPHGFDRLDRGRRFWHEHELTQPILLLPDWDGQSLGWPHDIFTDLGRTLSDQQLAVVAGTHSEGFAKDVADALSVPLITPDSMTQTMDILATSSLVIGNDNGLLHLADAMDRPTVTLTVTPHPWRTWPRSQVAHAIYRAQEEGEVHLRFDRVSVSDLAAIALRLKESS